MCVCVFLIQTNSSKSTIQIKEESNFFKSTTFTIPDLKEEVMQEEEFMEYDIEFDPLEDVIDEHAIYTLKDTYNDP